LFKTWEETGSVKAACQKAHVCERTFYHWKPRFETGSYEALENGWSHAPKHPHRIKPAVEERVREMRRQNPTWGKRRIADEIAKANDWKPLVSPNTVKRILKEAGLWTKPEDKGAKSKSKPAVRTAEEAGQTLNVDIAFVPASHQTEEKLPAVSGSSGRLVIEQPVEAEAEKQWPGRVFEDEKLEYSEAMLDFVNASQTQSKPEATVETPEKGEQASLKAQKRILRQEEEQLRSDRRVVRQQRKDEDAAWKTLKTEKQQKMVQPDRPPQKRKAQEEQWRTLRQQRQETLKLRKEENRKWKQKRLDFKQRWSELPVVTAWIAVLVVIDNCTRQCLGLPLFIVGPKVTSQMIVEALQTLLPPDLLFLITDRGVHFTAKAFQELTRNEEFIHVLIARHRPQSNGIAERFVRTLKEWLRDKSWENDEELAALLAQFRAEYDDRPHQGLPLPGLSPNEFAKRISAPSS